MNIDKYRSAANITEYHMISKLILQRIIIPKFMVIRQLLIWLKSVHKPRNFALMVQTEI